MKTVKIGEVEICYEIFGEENPKTIVLIAGLGSQMIRWEDPFCQLLVDKGFKVIRFDNRDSGSSVYISGKKIHLNGNIQEYFSTLKPEDLPYSLMDMAKDVIGLLDHLQIEKAHFVGRSMGGIIAQLLGSYFPERVLSLTIIMSTSLHPALPSADPEIMEMMMKPSANPVTEREKYFAEKISFARRISGSGYSFDQNLEIALIEEELNRSKTKNGIIRQLMAMGSYQYNPEVLKKITAPALVIHGTDDLIFHPECGKDIAYSIVNSEFVLIDGMGHSIPSELHSLICDLIADTVL
ncbi:alpha/beta hydrolase [Chryseobacterium sp.]|uniref:alpha/beta fold hydrolase n=1 Tax=Chryseobacterium sp. TaxID=1871047 RepID=UPI00261D542D|nr:alpha/beta hydrolase [Chryseobacterium sp.]